MSESTRLRDQPVLSRVRGSLRERKKALQAAARLTSVKKDKQRSAYVPEKYLAGLSTEERVKRRREIARGSKTESQDADAYSESRFETDFDPNSGQRHKTKTSEYTQRFYEYFPEAESLAQKAAATGVPLDILQRVYDRGLAAYRTGHRPGATQGQWAAARVHSFLVKGCTYYFPDHKLAAEAASRSSRAKEYFKQVDCFCKKGCKSGSRTYK